MVAVLAHALGVEGLANVTTGRDFLSASVRLANLLGLLEIASAASATGHNRIVLVPAFFLFFILSVGLLFVCHANFQRAGVLARLHGRGSGFLDKHVYVIVEGTSILLGAITARGLRGIVSVLL